MEEEKVEIPFIGGGGVGNNVTPYELADWVKEEDKVPILLALSLYQTPREELWGYRIIPNSYTIRLAAWFNEETGSCVIGCRGTSPGSSKGTQDLADDIVIAGSNKGVCDLSLVREGQKLYNTLKDQAIRIVFVGHSLGGTAALCLCSANPGTFAISFNGGAAPTNPVEHGPGPSRARFYHIFGDLISTHISPNAAEVIRIKKNGGSFGQVWPHASDRILRNDGSWTYATVDEEDEAFLKWGKSWKLGWDWISPAMSFTIFLQKRKIAQTSPIPGSKRYNEQLGKAPLGVLGIAI